MNITELVKKQKELEEKKKPYEDMVKSIDDEIKDLQEQIDDFTSKMEGDNFENDEIIISKQYKTRKKINSLNVLESPEVLNLLISTFKDGKCNVTITAPFEKVMMGKVSRISDYVNYEPQISFQINLKEEN